ncbi:hypothetical protein D3K63_23485, partial [Salmonella enterica subsp. enterica serovar Derby]|nr:hypothetical protein [Salmonella enterica subsp. enterica serovar Derby]
KNSLQVYRNYFYISSHHPDSDEGSRQMILITVIYHSHGLANSAVLRFFMILEILYKNLNE